MKFRLLYSARRCISLSVFSILCFGISSCKTEIKKQDVAPLIQNYLNSKYSLLLAVNKQGDSVLKQITDGSLSKDVLSKAADFKKNAKSLGLEVVAFRDTIFIDSMFNGADTARVFFREQLAMTFSLTGQADTFQTLYTNFYLMLVRKDAQLRIVGEGLLSQDPLYIRMQPSIKSPADRVDSVHQSGSAALATTYNRTAAVNYAYKYYEKPNAEFCNYDQKGGDCTNFASQCLLAGAWPMNSEWRAEGKSCCKNILACSIQNCYTCTWTVAHEFYLYLSSSLRVAGNSTPELLSVGDIVQQDYDQDGHIDHTMVVTKKKGTLALLTYRSLGPGESAMDKPVNQIEGNLTCWRLKDKF